jgi:hypothetical protein
VRVLKRRGGLDLDDEPLGAQHGGELGLLDVGTVRFWLVTLHGARFRENMERVVLSHMSAEVERIAG